MSNSNPEPTQITVDDLTLEEIDLWEEITGLTFTEARQMQQISAALWVARRRLGHTDKSPQQLMRETKAADLATLMPTPEAGPTKGKAAGVPSG
jgi:hypothetical protein